MKKPGFIFVFLTLFILTSCEEPAVTPELEGTFDPLSCTKSSAACGVDWLFSFQKGGFPINAQILINERIIIDECDPQSYWSINGETSKEIEFKIIDYVNVSGAETFSMRIFDRKDCAAAKVEHSYVTRQSYDVKNINGKKEVWVTR